MFVKHHVIEQVPVLSQVHMSVKKRLSLALKLQVFIKGEHVYDSGDVGHDIYFLAQAESYKYK